MNCNNFLNTNLARNAHIFYGAWTFTCRIRVRTFRPDSKDRSTMLIPNQDVMTLSRRRARTAVQVVCRGRPGIYLPVISAQCLPPPLPVSFLSSPSLRYGANLLTFLPPPPIR